MFKYAVNPDYTLSIYEACMLHHPVEQYIATLEQKIKDCKKIYWLCGEDEIEEIIKPIKKQIDEYRKLLYKIVEVERS